jgi:hypothetical protein
MEILTGIFILFCVGVVTGYSLLFARSHEAPPKEPQKQVMVIQNQDPGRIAGTVPQGAEAGRDASPSDAKPADSRQ